MVTKIKGFSLDRREIFQALRNQARVKERDDCCVCEQWKPICHLHHIVPVAELVNFCADNHYPYLLLPPVGIWLCPNHHYLLHAVKRANTPPKMAELLEGLEPHELSSIKALGTVENMKREEMATRLGLWETDRDALYNRMVEQGQVKD
jgi:hypothetical protein